MKQLIKTKSEDPDSSPAGSCGRLSVLGLCRLCKWGMSYNLFPVDEYALGRTDRLFFIPAANTEMRCFRQAAAL